MRLKLLTLSLILCSQAVASDFNLGVKFYRDGLYSLAAKTFSENLENLSPEDFKKYYQIIYLSFLNSKNFKSLEELINYWEGNFYTFKKGELLALKSIMKLHSGKPINQVIDREELIKLSIDDKIAFFKVLSKYSFSPDELLYIVDLSSKSTDLKGALKESGFLKKCLSTALEKKNYQLIDLLFDVYGKWFTSPEERLEYVKYLERKKRFSEALFEIEKLYKEYPEEKVKLELAKVYYLNGKYEEALNALENVNSEEAKYLKAWCYFKLGHSEKIPQLIGFNVSRPQIPEKLKILLDFYRSTFYVEKLKKLYPELYPKALIFSFSTQQPQYIGSYHDLGYIYYERGLYKKSLSMLEKAVQNPTNKLLLPRTLYLLGKIGSLNTEIASVVYTELMKNYQNTSFYKEALIPAAKSYLYSGNTVLAIKLLKYAEDQLGLDTDEVKKLLGISYTNQKNFKKGVLYLSKVSFKDGDTSTILAFDYFQIGNKEKAFETLKRQISTNGLYPEVNGGRLVYLSKLLKKESKIKDFHFESPTVQLMAAIVSNNPKEVERLLPKLQGNEKIAAALFLALEYENSAPDKAMEYLTFIFNYSTDKSISGFAKKMLNYIAFKSRNFEPVLFNDPKFIAYNPENGITSVDTLVSKAEDYIQTVEYGKAYGLLKLALQRTTLEDLRRKIVRRLVEIDLKERNYERALKDLELLPNTNELNKDLKNYLRFKVFLRMGKLIDAYTSAQSVKNINNIPQEERSLFLAKLAGYYKLTGEKEKALKFIKELLNLGKFSSVDYNDLVGLAIFAEKQEKLSEAEKLINEAIKKAKTKEQKAESLFWKASIQAKRGKTEEAILNYMKISYEYGDIEPWASTSLYRAAQLFEQKGDYEQALKLYQKVIKLKAGTKEGEIAAERVKSLLQKLKKEE
ncbi:Tetratricopeptide TPR_1 repeat-containing protein [Desulfurobacterium thermolithotrophum DSM 11699]|uniref:Tetratricopeptide TPR_1 repeat-containing protein n=1 Tax=Desulfurobacterium thermolithotrophum (strain DSM 11699 / BSA) TaxID=868864 RepID=F0S3A6_DESTD|nr:tetratricopeptide repeat protein [Desulfurobacterium thermolithotrophum]ADY73328.1 Tetratricopeptide TPR_1 repeat-containing protein [Desulfurobacterium thermolithotrophum DSM 11699]